MKNRRHITSSHKYYAFYKNTGWITVKFFIILQNRQMALHYLIF